MATSSTLVSSIDFGSPARNGAVWELSPDARAISWSPAVAPLLGLAGPEEAPPSLDDPIFVHHDDLNRVRGKVRRFLEGEQELLVECRLRHGRMGFVWVEISGRRMPGAEGSAGMGTLSRLRSVQPQRADERALAQAILDAQHEMVLRCLADSTILFANAAFARAYGKDRRVLIGQKLVDAIAPEDVPSYWQHVYSLNREVPDLRRESRRTIVGTKVPVVEEWLDHGIFAADGELREIQSVGRDVSEQRRDERRLRDDARRLTYALEGAQAGLWDADLVRGDLYISPRGAALLRCAGRPPKSLGQWLTMLPAPQRRQLTEALDLNTIEQGGRISGEYQFRCADGKTRWFEIRGQIIGQDEGGSRAIGTFIDVSKRHQAITKARHLAHHDPLTGLPNRIKFRECLDETLARAEREGDQVAVVFIDLDHFKDVNDTLGHSVGDRMLAAVGRRFRRVLRDGDLLARLGGDEFAVIAGRLKDADAVSALVSRLAEALNSPVQIGPNDLQTQSSMGVTIYPNDSKDADQLLSNADLALFEAKAGGRGQYRLFDPAMQQRVLDRRRVEEDFARALETDELALFYQPKIDLKTRRVIGFEALVRWHHPEQGLLGPGAFLDVVESGPMIHQLTSWVVDTACRELRSLKEDHDPSWSVAINLAAANLMWSDLLNHIDGCIAREQVPVSDLVLEITEGALADETIANKVLGDACQRGFTIALDDFGTGYSSLHRLRSLPVQELKLDRTFLAQAHEDPRDGAVADAILRLGRALGMKVLAEGVETEGQLAWLERIGCDAAQGYLIGRPMPLTDIGNWLERWHGDLGKPAA
ncbi:MAG: EAL domain-containing protein [Geminicoccaceae bacterium]